MKRLQQWPMFGPWAAFKAADLMERVYGAPIAFDRDIGIMYEAPRAGLLLAAGQESALASTYEQLLAHFGRLAAPPRYERMCGPAECETVACKFHAYVGGHYWIGHDIKETRRALEGWGTTADKILASYPAEVLRLTQAPSRAAEGDLKARAKIVQVVGTNGAGKSTLVRTLLDEAKRLEPDWYEWLDRRERTVATEVRFENGGGLFVPGHYQTPCGGCDTLKTVDQVFDLVKRGAEQGYNVLFEGIMVMDTVERTIALGRETDLTVIGLTTPLDACLDAVRDRRHSRGAATQLNPSNTVDRARRCSHRLERLEASGVKVLMMTREEALDWCRANLLNQQPISLSRRWSEAIA
jgi:hypothetical protein